MSRPAESTRKSVRRLFSAAIALLAFSVAYAADQARPAKPNVVLILTDDLGWQDVGCYDIDEPSPMETPNIDRLATKGVMFRQGYSPAPTCAPTRAAILSGIHPARAQMTHVSGGVPPAPHHAKGWAIIEPWYSARMPASTVTIAEALKAHGYTTGHCGKWHIAMSHSQGYPQPEDQGFDYTRHHLGVTRGMKPHRLTDFATEKADDPYRLDANGYPFHQNNEDALAFLRQSKDKPFFLYYATWLVHTPIHSRSKALLEKYCKKMGIPFPEDLGPIQEMAELGQKNPYYAAMVEMLDYYVGQVVDYLEETDDPRWPGHKLIENTVIIFTSDNGGMEQGKGERITDNYPLDRGKISLMEGGTRVPLIITGPGIPAGVQSDVMINGLDFYPTILSLTGAERPQGKLFDGCDIATLLQKDPTDPALVQTADGQPRDTLIWHFPNSAAQESSIRIGDYKLVRNYRTAIGDPLNKQPLLELYRLYDGVKRVDIEEAKNLADALPEKATAMDTRLSELLAEMDASFPYKNPVCDRLPQEDRAQCPAVVAHLQSGNTVECTYTDNGAKVLRANLIYTLNGGEKLEEWFQAPATVRPDMKVSAVLPEGTTHYFINLIDANNYLVSYPEVVTDAQPARKSVKFAERAIRSADTNPITE